MGVGLVLSFRLGGHDTGAGVVPHHPHGGLPIRTSSPHPSPYRKENPASKQAGGRITSAIASWLANENKQARRERRTASLPSPSSHGATVSPSHAASHQSPRSPDKHTTRRTTRRRNNWRRRAGKTNTETTRRTTKRKRTGHARRQASNETQDETTDDKTETRRRDARRQRQKQAIRGEARRTRRIKRSIFLTSRPTPSRLFSFIRRPQLLPRPRAWDERTAKQDRPARRLIHCLGGSHHSRHRLIRFRSPHLLIPGVIFHHAPFSVAHPSMPPSSPPTQDDRAKRPPPPLIRAFIQRSVPRQAERGEKRNERMACGSRSSSRSSSLMGSSLRVVARRILRSPVAYLPARFHPG